MLSNIFKNIFLLLRLCNIFKQDLSCHGILLSTDGTYRSNRGSIYWVCTSRNGQNLIIIDRWLISDQFQWLDLFERVLKLFPPPLSRPFILSNSYMIGAHHLPNLCIMENLTTNSSTIIIGHSSPSSCTVVKVEVSTFSNLLTNTCHNCTSLRNRLGYVCFMTIRLRQSSH